MLQYQGIPSLDLDHGFLRAWWFDPMSATVAFGVSINWYWYHERRLGLSSDPTFGSTVQFSLGPLFSSGLAYWVGILLWKLVVPPAADEIPDGIPSSASELAYLLAEVVSGIIAYDAIFFFVHWAMHGLRCFQRFHRRHHAHSHLEARDTLRHSVVDGSLQVIINIALQRHTLWGGVKTRLARLLHNIIVIWMLTESHAAAPTPYVWRRWCVGVREHHRHHTGREGELVRHQQFFGYLDNWRARYQIRVGKGA